MLTCGCCGKSYDPKTEKHVPQLVEETRGMMVIRFARGCKVEKL